jgi:hypothetical protein
MLDWANSDLVQCSKTGYSITSAAATSSVAGTVRPSAFAVLRVMARFWSAEPPGHARPLRPQNLTDIDPDLSSYPGTQLHLGQMTRRGCRQAGTWLFGRERSLDGQIRVATELTSNRSYGRRRLRLAKRATRCRPWRRGVGAPHTSGRGSCARARRMNGERGTR